MSQTNNSSEYFFQKGGSVNLPMRYFNSNATAFSGPCKQAPVVEMGIPKMEYNRIGKGQKQHGGGIQMPNRFYNPDAPAFSGPVNIVPSGSGGCSANSTSNSGMKQNGGSTVHNAPIYYNEFRESEGNHTGGMPESPNMSGGSGGSRCGSCRQTGGFPTGAPLTVYTQGEPLQYNFQMDEVFSGLPQFDKVGANHLWR